MFGIPISIKDHICEEGERATVGSTWMAVTFRAEKDASIVTHFKKEGAIPMVRGNVPQLLSAGHTDNRIFGCALNPYDKTRTCGGSSGGDGALVSAKCIPFAIATDIGGSIRSPAACSGVIGFKPTS
jgi:Asp-tRNA(Asn)/Glu-tRNA(Gln) amidotransferase A subunit family amidase